MAKTFRIETNQSKNRTVPVEVRTVCTVSGWLKVRRWPRLKSSHCKILFPEGSIQHFPYCFKRHICLQTFAIVCSISLIKDWNGCRIFLVNGESFTALLIKYIYFNFLSWFKLRPKNFIIFCISRSKKGIDRLLPRVRTFEFHAILWLIWHRLLIQHNFVIPQVMPHVIPQTHSPFYTHMRLWRLRPGHLNFKILFVTFNNECATWKWTTEGTEYLSTYQNADHYTFLGNCPPSPPLSQHQHLLLT